MFYKRQTDDCFFQTSEFLGKEEKYAVKREREKAKAFSLSFQIRIKSGG